MWQKLIKLLDYATLTIWLSILECFEYRNIFEDIVNTSKSIYYILTNCSYCTSLHQSLGEEPRRKVIVDRVIAPWSLDSVVECKSALGWQEVLVLAISYLLVVIFHIWSPPMTLVPWPGSCTNNILEGFEPTTNTMCICMLLPVCISL